MRKKCTPADKILATPMSLPFSFLACQPKVMMMMMIKMTTTTTTVVVVNAAGQFFDIIHIAVEILDVNDHTPRFGEDWSSFGVTLNISETVLRGSAFSLPGAVDEDSGTFGVQGYRLVNMDQPGDTSDLPFDLVFEPR